MTTQMKVHKVNALPGTLEASALYLVKSGTNGLFDLYCSDNTGTAARHIISQSEITTLINNAVTAASSLKYVANIAARDALNPSIVTIAIVVDATADTTVAAGAASYVYDPVGAAWHKIAEYESMDMTLYWADIQNRPSSAVADIDDAVSKRHAHANAATLAKWGEDVDGNPTYNSNNLQVYLNSDEW